MEILESSVFSLRTAHAELIGEVYGWRGDINKQKIMVNGSLDLVAGKAMNIKRRHVSIDALVMFKKLCRLLKRRGHLTKLQGISVLYDNLSMSAND